MMFLQAPPATGFGTDDIGDNLGVTQFASEFKNALSDALNPDRFQTFFLKLEDQAKKSARVLGSGVQNYSVVLNDTMYNVYKNTLKIGGELGDTSDFLSAIHTSMGTLPSVQQPVIENAIALSKLTSMSVKEIGQYVGEFAKIGLGQQDAINKLNKIYANAKKFGVDASKLTKTVTENLTKANTYGFKGGVEGLTKMAIQAQKLGMSMSNVFKIAEDALDPEKAMEMASEMQMLGGNVGALADPFRLMYLAQNDVKGLQDEFVKAASSAAIFNEKTGEFEITGEQMRRLRAQADSLGVSYDEIAETAIRAKKEQMVMSKVPLNLKVSDETKGIISSLAEVKGGKVQIQIPGTDNMVDVANLTQTQIQQIEKMGAEAKDLEDKKKVNMTNMAQQQLSAAEGQIIAMNELRNSLITMTDALSKQKAIINATKGTSRLTGDGPGGAVETIQNTGGAAILTTMVNAITNGQTLLQDYITNTGTVGLKHDIGVIIGLLSPPSYDTAGDMFLPDGSAPTIMSEGNVYKGIVGDQVLMGTKLDEAFQVSAEEMKRSRAIAESLGSNLESIGDPFKNMATATVQNKMTSPITKLQETITTTNNNINVSGGATVSGSVDVKVTGNGINLEDPRLSALITAKASALIEERLSKSWGQKQGNLSTM